MKIKAKIIIYLIAFIGFTIWGISSLKNEDIYISTKDENSNKNSGDFLQEKIYVHIDGAILIPGIKEINKGTRLFELIEISGGALDEADLSRVNLSSVLKDEQKIIIPYKVYEQSITSNSTNAGSSYNSASSKIININYASKTELETLNGIGPSMAEKIITYRNENGLFNSIEDIKNVSGIGEGKYNKIKEDITI